MKTYAFYGSGIAFLGFVMAAIFNFTGMHTDPSRLATANLISSIVGPILSIVLTFLAIREVKSNLNGEAKFTYADGFKVGFFVALFAAVTSVGTNYIYTSVINPDFREVMIRSQVEKMRLNNVPEANISQATEMIRRFSHPFVSAIFTFLASLAIGTILSLIIAIFTRKEAVATR
ncbi:DUF4199 domain-containing protein [Nibricoccus sp. IMCC34717]|uniref:DUF4199 domain-containing protein n=1 Tax=Nibricoccus sp. IMCC34717 TaxID=3034021 RepID=UPI00384EB481